MIDLTFFRYYRDLAMELVRIQLVELGLADRFDLGLQEETNSSERMTGLQALVRQHFVRQYFVWQHFAWQFFALHLLLLHCMRPDRCYH